MVRSVEAKKIRSFARKVWGFKEKAKDGIVLRGVGPGWQFAGVMYVRPSGRGLCLGDSLVPIEEGLLLKEDAWYTVNITVRELEGDPRKENLIRTRR